MFEPCLSPVRASTFFRSIRSSRGVVHAYVPILGRPGRSGAQLPNKAISSVLHHLRFGPILMNQDDSKQCEHLLSQQNSASYLALGALNLTSISLRSPRW
mgnify:CR=1 FL=1